VKPKPKPKLSTKRLTALPPVEPLREMVEFKTSPVWLNLGSGSTRYEGWLNVDVRSEVNPDHVADVVDLPFRDESVDLIYASHILEHMKDCRPLEEWHRVLKIGGRLIVAVPDILQAAAFLDAGIWDAKYFQANVYGSQVYGHDQKYFTHHQAFTSKLLIAEMTRYFTAVALGCDGTPRQPCYGEVVVQGTKN